MDAFYLLLHFLSSILPFPICQEIVICFCFSTLFLAMLFSSQRLSVRGDVNF